jgi:hypothetical protein
VGDSQQKELRVAAETTTEDQEQEYGYTIDGEIYPEPENLTMDDHRIVKRYTGYDFRALAAMSADVMYVDQDGIAAIMHISYRHKHPELGFDEIAEIIGRQTLEEAQASLQKATDGEVPLDLESTPKPDESSPTKKPSTSDPSGTDSRKSSDHSDENPATTGTPESDTLSPQSVLATPEALAS